jgi:hypothetical protein
MHTMKHHLTRIITVVFISLGLCSALSAVEPRMEKAIQLLQQAQASPNPVPLLEKAQEHLQNATGNKGGNKVEAVKTIKQAIKTAQRGGNARAQIGQAIAQVRAGINAR